MTSLDTAERSDGPAVLEIVHATLGGEDGQRRSVMHGSLRADPGELVLVQVGDLREAELWADTAVGLKSPESGEVRILGNDLADLDMETGNWLRGRIGRVFCRGNWLESLSLLDNILLPARHHSHRGDDDLKSEASLLARKFGMPGIPLGTPESVSREDRQCAAWVRAFIGDPLLVILEHPTYATRDDLLKPLIDAIRAVRDRGAAVLWFSPTLEIWRDRSIPANRRYRVAVGELIEVGAR